MFRINPQFSGIKTSSREEMLKLCKTNIGELHPRQCAHYFDAAGNVCVESFADMRDIRDYCWRLVVNRIVNERGTRWTFRNRGEKVPQTPQEMW